MKSQNLIIHRNHWEYALSLLKNYGVSVIDERMTFSGTMSGLVIHSKQLCNVIHIPLKDTNNDIRLKIEREIKISQNI